MRGLLGYRARLAVAMPLVIVGLLLEDFGEWIARRGDRLARLATRIEGEDPR